MERNLDHDHVYRVNEVVAAVGSLHGRTIRIAGILCLEFEEHSPWHQPRGERLPDCGSSLWPDFDHEAIGLDHQSLAAFDGRHES